MKYKTHIYIVDQSHYCLFRPKRGVRVGVWVWYIVQQGLYASFLKHKKTRGPGVLLRMINVYAWALYLSF